MPYSRSARERRWPYFPAVSWLRMPALKTAGGFGRITLAQNVSSREEVDGALSQAVSAGGTLLKRPSETDWGGYSGYFADPDGHPWEVAYNPLFELRQGKLVLPD